MTKQDAVVLQKRGVINIEKRDVPEIVNPHDVKLQIKATGICGSDIHYYTHGSIGPFVVKGPMILGHESSGIVTDVGPAVTRVKVGDRVALEPGIPDRFSDETMSGHYNLCPSLEFAATPPYDGTLTKYFLAPEDFVHKIPDYVSFEEGALAEPLSVGVHANKLAGTRYGSKVLVFGAGTVGLLAGAVSKAFGAKEVVFVDLFDDKLERARHYGATHTVHASKNEDLVVGEVAKVLGGDRPNIVLDCSGAEPAIRTGVKACKSGGTFVQIGNGKPNVEFPISEVVSRELRIQGSFRYDKGDFDDAISLISSGKIDAKSLVSQRYTFEQGPEACEFAAQNPEKVTKVVITGPE